LVLADLADGRLDPGEVGDDLVVESRSLGPRLGAGNPPVADSSEAPPTIVSLEAEEWTARDLLLLKQTGVSVAEYR
jgi:hypothetical protein